MMILILGLILWSAMHLLPSVAPSLRQAAVDKLGLKAYSGVFALLVLTAVALMVLGWRGSQPSSVYLPPESMRPVALLLMVLAFLCLGASNRATRIGRMIRHPQLTGLLLWSISHLMTNGDSRSLILFVWLGSWAVLEMILISRREGQWQKPQAPAWTKEVLGAAITLGVMAVVMFIHPWLAGVSLF